MIITARQLEDFHKAAGGNGQVTLPYRARLTPLAADLVRAKKLVIGYSEVAKPAAPVVPQTTGSLAGTTMKPATAPAGNGAFIWWCDGPCGPAKAAIVAEEKQSALRPLDMPADPRQLVAVVKTLAADVSAGRVAGGILLMQSAALAGAFANRCPALRAVVGTSLDAVSQGLKQIAANVLIIEYPQKTMQQVRNMAGAFLRSPRSWAEDAERQWKELATCG